MKTKYTVKLKTIVKDHKLTVLHAARNYDTAVLTTADVNRPAMQLTGFYNYFDPKRLQIIGNVESTYLKTLTHEERLAAYERFMAYDISALVFCHKVQPSSECLEMAEKYDRNVFSTNEDTSDFQAAVIMSLHNYLAPRKTIHGVLMEIYGEGVLITGDSGIGKSETALELIKRGHRLVADDAVEIKLVSGDILVGSSPELIRYYMVMRGIGVINVRHTYGVGAIKPENVIDLVVHLEHWINGKAYDQLGLEGEADDEASESILGVKLPCVTIPVKPGRNLAVILELAAMNNRQKKMGYNAAEALTSEHDRLIDAGISF